MLLAVPLKLDKNLRHVLGFLLMNQNNVLLIKMLSDLGVCLFSLSYMMSREDVRVPRKLVLTSAELLWDKSSFYSIVTGFFSSFFSETKLGDKVSFTLTDPSWFYLNIPTVYLVTCQSSSLQSQLHPQLASSASQFALMLHIVTMQVWQAHLGFKIILYIFVALSDMSFQCTIFTPQATRYSLETGLLHWTTSASVLPAAGKIHQQLQQRASWKFSTAFVRARDLRK